MLITLVVPERDLFLPQEVDPSVKLAELTMLVALEVGIPEDKITFIHDGKPILNLDKSFAELNIKNGDMLVVGKRQEKQQPAAVTDDVEQLRRYILSNPPFQRQLAQTHPEMLAAASQPPSDPRFAQLVADFQRQLTDRSSIEAEKAALYRQLAQDPFNVEAQRRIEELIQQENIEQNMEQALEHHPESFGQVQMLYVNCTVNGKPVKAFVDCGAQTTISKDILSAIDMNL